MPEKEERLVFRAAVAVVEVLRQEEPPIYEVMVRYQDSELEENNQSQVAGTMVSRETLSSMTDLDGFLESLLEGVRVSLVREVGNPNINQDPG